MEKEIVSIITPCYNNASIIYRLLDSILNQSYPNIEMFVIDDGSTDNLSSIIRNYIAKFEKKGYSLTYIYQENQGQSVAINNGLKLIKGKYLVWPDSDDYYASDIAIESMVEILKNAKANIGAVRTLAYVRDEDTLKIKRKIK